jgi:hypothetical protein
MAAPFERRQLLNYSEYQIFKARSKSGRVCEDELAAQIGDVGSSEHRNMG